MSLSSPAAAAKRLEEPGVPAFSKLFSWSLFLSPKKRTLLFSLLLIAGVLAFYSPVTHNGFLNYDDNVYLTDNPHVRAGLTWPTVKWAFNTYYDANYHPLTWLSHALDCQLFGLNPGAHHEVSVLLHAANAVLLFLLLQGATGFAWRSLFVAALFALHPVNVESVAWAAERKNVLSMLFFLLALHAYVWYTRRPALRRYALIGLLFALALLSKPQVITLPFLLLLLDYWPLRRVGTTLTRTGFTGLEPGPQGLKPASIGAWSDTAKAVPFPNPIYETRSNNARSENSVSENVVAENAHPEGGMTTTASAPPRSIGWLVIVIEKLPLLALSAASAVVTMKAQKAGGAVQTLSLYSPLLRLETAVIAYVRYLGKAFWPANLVVLYPHPTLLYPAWQVGAAVLLLVLITVAVLRARERRYLAVGWFWFLGSLVPMIGLVQVGAQAIADRYAYIPFLGLFLMLTWLISDVFEGNVAQTGHARAAWLAVPALATLLVLGVLTYVQVGYWHDIQSFWTRTLELTEDNYIAHDTLAEYLTDRGQIEEAAGHYRAALAIRPDDLPANLNLGAYDHAHGNFQAAIERYWIVARRAADPGLRGAAYGNLGSAYRQLGDLAQAKQCFETSLDLVPERSMPMIGLGLIAQKNGDLPEAVRQYSQAMAVEPTDVGYLLLAQALQQEGRSDEAKAISDRVARLSPNLGEAQKEAQSLIEGK